MRPCVPAVTFMGSGPCWHQLPPSQSSLPGALCLLPSSPLFQLPPASSSFLESRPGVLAGGASSEHLQGSRISLNIHLEDSASRSGTIPSLSCCGWTDVRDLSHKGLIANQDPLSFLLFRWCFSCWAGPLLQPHPLLLLLHAEQHSPWTSLRSRGISGPDTTVGILNSCGRNSAFDGPISCPTLTLLQDYISQKALHPAESM